MKFLFFILSIFSASSSINTDIKPQTLSQYHYPDLIKNNKDAKLYNSIAQSTLVHYIQGLEYLKYQDYNQASSSFLDSYINNIDNHIGEKSFMMYIYSLFCLEDFFNFEEKLINFKKTFPDSADIEFLDFLRVLLLFKQDCLIKDREIYFIKNLLFNIERFLGQYYDSNSLYVQWCKNKIQELSLDIYYYYLYTGDALLTKNVLSAALEYEKIMIFFSNNKNINLEEPLFKCAYCFNQSDVAYKRDFYWNQLEERYSSSKYIKYKSLVLSNPYKIVESAKKNNVDIDIKK